MFLVLFVQWFLADPPVKLFQPLPDGFGTTLDSGTVPYTRRTHKWIQGCIHSFIGLTLLGSIEISLTALAV